MFLRKLVIYKNVNSQFSQFTNLVLVILLCALVINNYLILFFLGFHHITGKDVVVHAVRV